MLTIVSGSIDKVKTELKQVQKWKADEEKILKNKIRSWTKLEKKAAREEKRKENQPPKDLTEKLKEIGIAKGKMFSGIVPARVEDITIDYKTYQQAVNKLKDFVINLEVKNKELILCYPKGRIHLYDVSSFFVDLHSIPVARVDYDKEA